MKKIFALALAVVMALSLAACAAKQAPVSEKTGAPSYTINPGKLVMSTNAKFPPYEMVAGDGSFEGIDVEIATAIAEKLGLELVVDDMEFTSALQAAQNGKSDIVMAGVTVNEDRLKVMSFSDTYSTGVQVVIVKEGSDITLDNLGEQTIGTQAGTTGYIYCCDDYGDDHVVSYPTGAAAVQALANGQVDCVVIDNLPAQEYVKANEGLVILDTEYTTEDYAIGMAKDNTELLDAVNGALAELKADGTVDKIVEKYIGAK